MWKSLQTEVSPNQIEIDVNKLRYDFDMTPDKGTPEIRPPCRTPMGSYIIPEDGLPLTSLGDPMPGPADYLPKIDLTKTGTPHYSLVGKPKSIEKKSNVPAPFNYNTSGDITWKKKKVTLKSRCKSYFDEEAEKSISLLGKYKVEHLAFGKDGPKFKMGIRFENNINTGPPNTQVQPTDTKGFNTPGPNYRPNSSYWGRGHTKSFGDRWKSRDPKGPGPGDYNVNTTYRGTSKSFGVKLPEPVTAQQTLNKFSPAANTYNLGTTIGKAPAISIAGRQKQNKSASRTPCPSTYTLEYKTDKYKPTTLAYRWFEMEEPKKPGPADHNVKHVNIKTNPSFTCRQRVKTSYPDSVTYDRVPDDIPGPGAYNPYKEIHENDKPAHSLRKRLEPQIDREGFPGPNAYIPEKQDKPGCRKAPSFSMAKRLEPPNSMKDTPGPGEYSPAVKQSKKGQYTMTSRPKGKGSFVNPSPNKYSLPELISGKKKGVVFKSRASPYVYSGFRSNKLIEPQTSLSVV